MSAAHVQVRVHQRRGHQFALGQDFFFALWRVVLIGERAHISQAGAHSLGGGTSGLGIVAEKSGNDIVIFALKHIQRFECTGLIAFL